MCRLARAKVRIARDRKVFIKTLFTSSCVRDRNCKETLENSRIENRIRVSRNFEKKKDRSIDRCFFRGESGGGAQGHGNGPYGDHGLIIIQVASHYRR